MLLNLLTTEVNQVVYSGDREHNVFLIEILQGLCFSECLLSLYGFDEVILDDPVELVVFFLKKLIVLHHIVELFEMVHIDDLMLDQLLKHS